MIALIAMLATGQAVAGAPPPVVASEELVVSGIRKLENWRAVLVFERDVPTCRVLTPTDDADINAIGCTTMVECFLKTRDQFATLTDKALTASKRRALRTTANRDLDDCFKSTHRAMMIDLTNRRRPAQPQAE